VKQHHSHSLILRTLVAATASSALVSGMAAEPTARPDVTVAVYKSHFALAGRVFDDPDKLGAVIDAMNPRSVGIDACGPGSTRPLMVAVYRLRSRPLYLQAHQSDEAACAQQGAAVLTVSLRALRIDDKDEVHRYWRSIAP